MSVLNLSIALSKINREIVTLFCDRTEALENETEDQIRRRLAGVSDPETDQDLSNADRATMIAAVKERCDRRAQDRPPPPSEEHPASGAGRPSPAGSAGASPSRARQSRPQACGKH